MYNVLVVTPPKYPVIVVTEVPTVLILLPPLLEKKSPTLVVLDVTAV